MRVEVIKSMKKVNEERLKGRPTRGPRRVKEGRGPLAGRKERG